MNPDISQIILSVVDTTSVVGAPSMFLDSPFVKYFTFFMSSIVTIIIIYKFVMEVVFKPRLSVLLTKEIFCRMLETGESVYTNVILLSNEQSSLITDIQGKLDYVNPVSGTKMSFPLELHQIGEKFRKDDGSICFSFDSSSPLSHVIKEIPSYKTIIFLIKDNKNSIQNHCIEFRKTAYDLLNQLKPEDDDIVSGAIIEKLDTLRQTYITSLSTALKLDVGDYTFSLNVTYKQKRIWHKNKTKHAVASVRFRIGSDFKSVISNGIEWYLSDIMLSHSDKNNPISAASYNFVDVVEVVSE